MAPDWYRREVSPLPAGLGKRCARHTDPRIRISSLPCYLSGALCRNAGQCFCTPVKTEKSWNPGSRVPDLRISLPQVQIVTGPYPGNAELLPRICCDSSGDTELPFLLRRMQYPVKLAWVITINKSQGQSVAERHAVYLPAPVFAHGQLYVALSRGTSSASARVLLNNW